LLEVAMPVRYAGWRDLENQFRKLLEIPDIPEAARLAASYCDGEYSIIDGPRDSRQKRRLADLFVSLATEGVRAAGLPDGADALRTWLQLLLEESRHLHAMPATREEAGSVVPDDRGWIDNVILASAEYCAWLAGRGFELNTAGAADDEPVAAPEPAKRTIVDEAHGRYVALSDEVLKQMKLEAFLNDHRSVSRTQFTDYRAGRIGGRISGQKREAIEAAIGESAKRLGL
jgi:hypothetical protein